MMAYRSAFQETTGYSPNRMLLGREVEVPLDKVIGVPVPIEKKCTGIEYVDRMRDQLEVVHEVARRRIKMHSNRQKRNYDVKAQNVKYERGDAVWMHNLMRRKGVCLKLVFMYLSTKHT